MLLSPRRELFGRRSKLELSSCSRHQITNAPALDQELPNFSNDGSAEAPARSKIPHRLLWTAIFAGPLAYLLVLPALLPRPKVEVELTGYTSGGGLTARAKVYSGISHFGLDNWGAKLKITGDAGTTWVQYNGAPTYYFRPKY